MQEITNGASQLIALAVAIWIVLALVGLKWRSLRRARRGYERLYIRLVLWLWSLTWISFKWLWKRDVHGGAAHMASPPRLTSRDED